MKNHFKSALVMIGMVAFAMSCQEKEDENPVKIAAQVDEVVNVLVEEFLPLEIQGGDENESFGFRVLPDEIDNFNAKEDTEKPKETKVSLENCLSSIELTDAQTKEVREIFIGMLECRQEIFQSFREEILKIIKSMEEYRLEMLIKLLREEITRDEFKNSMLEIREKYKGALEEIREKHKEDLKPCVRGFVENLRQSLGEENWEKLVSCIRK
jgi:hypothetical protein